MGYEMQIEIHQPEGMKLHAIGREEETECLLNCLRSVRMVSFQLDKYGMVYVWQSYHEFLL